MYAKLLQRCHRARNATRDCMWCKNLALHKVTDAMWREE
jgi:hypothetical protein